MLTRKPNSNVFSFLVSLLLFITSVRAIKTSGQCQEITVPMCKQIGYNATTFPNELDHNTQNEAGMEIHQFWPLVEIGCSDQLRFFLCSKYVPICLPNFSKTLQACKKVCEVARAGCEPVMQHYGFEWPERFDCDKLITKEESLLEENRQKNLMCMQDDHLDDSDPVLPPTKIEGSKPPGNEIPEPIGPKLGPECCSCNSPFKKLTGTSPYYKLNVTTGLMSNCAMSCKSPHFDDNERKFTPIWLGIWSCLCFVSTSVMVLTFLIDMSRFKYPERPIIFLSGCYMFVAIGFMIRLVAGHEAVACNDEIIRYDISGRPPLCITVFILTYFFSMASSIWWVILSLTWFLAAGLKWGSEAIANYSWWFHLVGWVIPTIQTAVVIFTNSVDGDPVSGICYVGNQSIENLRFYVLGPLIVYLFTGTMFLLAGFVSLFKIRHVIKRGGTNTEKLEKLMMRIGVFSFFYTVPAAVVIACYFYEHRYRVDWEKRVTCPCVGRNYPTPEYFVFVCKYFMLLVVGITSGFWIWTNKTINSWLQFGSKILGGRGNNVPKVPMTHV
ncbi:frizzled-5-like [Convolutriloba macropyga]|uniref:frizzled-5-like n=1 Tax=Convolutriloba macropyga TaxID=536237 RepID=UPI003F51E7B2